MWQLEADAAQTELNELANLRGQRVISTAEWLAARAPIVARLDANRKHLSQSTKIGLIRDLTGQGKVLRREWAFLPLTRQRAIVKPSWTTPSLVPVDAASTASTPIAFNRPGGSERNGTSRPKINTATRLTMLGSETRGCSFCSAHEAATQAQTSASLRWPTMPTPRQAAC